MMDGRTMRMMDGRTVDERRLEGLLLHPVEGRPGLPSRHGDIGAGRRTHHAGSVGGVIEVRKGRNRKRAVGALPIVHLRGHSG